MKTFYIPENANMDGITEKDIRRKTIQITKGNQPFFPSENSNITVYINDRSFICSYRKGMADKSKVGQKPDKIRLSEEMIELLNLGKTVKLKVNQIGIRTYNFSVEKS